MANEKQFKLKTTFVATRGVEEYRQTISTWVNREDSVLEIGCEWGTTCIMIAKSCKKLIATDISLDCIERAKNPHPEVQFETLDAFDVLAAQKLGAQFDKIYIDMSGLSGYRSLLDAIALMQMYATVLRPRAIIIKSGSLKSFAARCIAWKDPGQSPAKTEREDNDGG